MSRLRVARVCTAIAREIYFGANECPFFSRKSELRGRDWRQWCGMPSRENKTNRAVNPAERKAQQKPEAAFGKYQQKVVYRAGHDTRINAFVNSLGRRSQAKRDAR